MSVTIQSIGSISDGRSALNSALIDTILRPAERLGYYYSEIRFNEGINAKDGSAELVATTEVNAVMSNQLTLLDDVDGVLFPTGLDEFAMPLWRLVLARYAKAKQNGAPADMVTRKLLARTKINGFSCTDYVPGFELEINSDKEESSTVVRQWDLMLGTFLLMDGRTVRQSDIATGHINIYIKATEITRDSNAKQQSIYALKGRAEVDFFCRIHALLGDQLRDILEKENHSNRLEARGPQSRFPKPRKRRRKKSII